MALQKQKVPISFAQGLDTKTDDKQVLATKLLELENGVFTKIGKIAKRFGYDILSQRIEGSSTQISSGSALSRFRDELILFSGNNLYAFTDANVKWTEQGEIKSVKLEPESVIKNPHQQTVPSYDSNGQLGAYCWEDSRGGIRYSIKDESSGSFLTSDLELTSAGAEPRVFSIGNSFIFCYRDGNSIQARHVPLSDIFNISTEITVITDLDTTDKTWSATKAGDRVFFVWFNNNIADPGKKVSVRNMLSGFQVGTRFNFIAVSDPTDALAIEPDSDDNLWMYGSDSDTIFATVVDYSLESTIADMVNIDSALDAEFGYTTKVSNITAAPSDTLNMEVLYEVSDRSDPTADRHIKIAETHVTALGTSVITDSTTVFKRGLGLASRMFNHDDKRYALTVFDSELQSTYFFFATDGDLMGKINPALSGGYVNKAVLPATVSLGGGVFKTPTLKKVKLISEEGVLFTRLGVQSNKIDFSSINKFISSELGENLHVVGSVVHMYDGANVVEHGFHIFPEDVSGVEGAAGNVINGTYLYSAVYAWIDNDGQIHRSVPSIPNSVTVAGGPSKVTITVPTLKVTKKEDVFIELYRTEDNGLIFYKVTTVDSPELNDPNVDTIDIEDDIADADLISNELLYITGGVLDNTAPPACSISETFKSRIFINKMDDENTIQYSKIREQGAPVEFNDGLTISVDSLGGGISAYGVLDDKFIIFKQNAIFVLAGEGPNNLGLQNDYIEPQLITSDVGCSDPKSIVRTPKGLMFKSSKGVYLLDRSLQTSYIGAEVERFNDESVTSAVLVPDTNQVRFGTEDDRTLVYDYFFRQWSTFSNHEQVGAVVYENKYVFAKSDGTVYQENSEKFTDGTIAIPLRIGTSWIQTQGIQGFQRVYNVKFLGSYKSAHKLKIQIGYNFNDAYIHEVDIDAEALLGTTSYGEDSPYGEEDTTYGGEHQLYQWKVHTKIQKCESIRFLIEDVQTDSFGESYDLSAMTLEIGAKQGTFKLPDSSQFGAGE